MRTVQTAALVLAFMCAITSPVSAITPGDWEKLQYSSKDWFLHGMISDWVAMEVVRGMLDQNGATGGGLSFWEGFVKPIVSCIETRKMRDKQIVGIVDKYVKDHPNEWDKLMVAVATSALYQACKEDGSLGQQ